MQTIKKKKIKTAKKDKRQQIEHTTKSVDETITKTTITEQAFIEQNAASETHEQTIKTVSLDVAPQHTETFVFDENTLPMEIDTGPKPLEIQPLFHASNIIAADITESGTHIHLKDSPIQTCLVNITERTPLIISEMNKTESVDTREPDKFKEFSQISSTLVTSSATVNDQIIPCDNINEFQSKAMPATAVAEQSSVLHESKTIFEQIATIKEDSFTTVHSLSPQQAKTTVDTQKPIQIEEIDVGETEKLLTDKYEPITQSAICSLISNTALNTQETLVENSLTKYYPETFIATEEAIPKYVEQIPYQTQEICVTESENAIERPNVPEQKHARLEFTSLQAITMEQTDVSERETISSQSFPTDIMAIAKDSFDLHKEMQTGFSQPIDSVQSCEPIVFSTKKASLSIAEMDGKLIETVNVLQSEKPFIIIKPHLEQEAHSSFISQEGFIVSETLAQENETEFPITPQTFAKASKSHEVHKTIEQNDEQLLDATGDYHHKVIAEVSKVQTSFELQKSIVHETTVVHDSEQRLDTKLQANQPYYSMDTTLKSPIVITEVQVHEDNTDFTAVPMAQMAAKKTQELYSTYEQHDDQVLDSTSEYHGKDKPTALNAQTNFELQKSMIGETVFAHDLEETFETKLKTNEPLYKIEPNVKNPIIISENQIQERSTIFSPEIINSMTATTAQEFYTAPDLSENLVLETFNDYQQRDKPQESNVNINFELQKSMINETIIPQDSEKTFDVDMHEIQPKYKLNTNTSSSIVVSETQLIDSEKLLDIKCSENQQLNVIDTPKQVTHVGSISEPFIYDSHEPIQTSVESKVSARQEPIVHHEIAVEMSTASDSLDRLETTKLLEQKRATSSVVEKNALNIMVEQISESLDKLNVEQVQEQIPTIQSDILPIKPIVINKTETLEHSSYLESDTFKTSTASVSTTQYNVPNIGENWPMEMLEDLKQKPSIDTQSTIQQFIESSAIETTAVIISDTIADIKESINVPIKPKVSLNEQKSILTEDIISHESAEQKNFTLSQAIVHGHIVKDVEKQRRCEQMQQYTYESIGSLQTETMEQTTSITKNISDALTTAKIFEIQPNLSENLFENQTLNEQHGKLIQENFNVVGQSLQDLLLESEKNLPQEMQIKQEYPKKSIEGMSFYTTSEIELLEKEKEVLREQHEKTQLAKTITDHPLTVANVSVDTVLSSVQLETEQMKDTQTKIAIPNVERMFEGIKTESIQTHETTSNVIVEETKPSKAQPTLEQRKSVQVENVRTLDREQNLRQSVIEHKTCDQRIEENLKSVISEIVEPIEQISSHVDLKSETKMANELASEINQSITFESVYLQEENILNETAKMIEKTTAHAVKVIEQTALQKETIFDEYNTEKLLIKPIAATQVSAELNSAQMQSEINTIDNIKINKKADKITNKKTAKKMIKKTHIEEGRWIEQNHIQISIFSITGI